MKKILPLLVLCLLSVADAKEKKKKTPCEEATEKVVRYSQKNAEELDACAAANAVGQDYPYCLAHAEALVRLDQLRLKACGP